MTDFDELEIFTDNLVQFFTGSYATLAILLSGLFLMFLLVRGLDFRYASVFTLPLIGFFVGIGWFGVVESAQWIVNLSLVVVSFFYGVAVVRIMS